MRDVGQTALPISRPLCSSYGRLPDTSSLRDMVSQLHQQEGSLYMLPVESLRNLARQVQQRDGSFYLFPIDPLRDLIAAVIRVRDLVQCIRDRRFDSVL